MAKKIYYTGQRHEHLGKEMVLVHHQWWYYADTKEEADRIFEKACRENAIAILTEIKRLVIEQTFYEEKYA